LTHRAQAHMQLQHYQDAVDDCEKALKLNKNNSKAYIRKGTALFNLKEFNKACETFKDGQQLFPSETTYNDWIKKCENSMPILGPPKPAVRHEWYQTHTHVIVTVFAKGIKKDNLTVDVDDKKLKIDIKEYQGSPFLLDIILAHTILPDQCKVQILSTKIEVKLKKSEGIQWAKLEGSEADEPIVAPNAQAVPDPAAARYPTSSHYTRDWDKIEKEVKEEEKNEKLDGDAGLNQFFQNLYADASDETKKAMMKSFSESGGTVLSTNWSEVGAKKVEVKPPDGMEYKQWES